jgi:hypothetical protein
LVISAIADGDSRKVMPARLLMRCASVVSSARLLSHMMKIIAKNQEITER